MLRRLGQAYEAFNLIADVAETASLAAVAVHRQVLDTKRLLHEVGNHTPIVELHARPVGIEDAHDTRVHVVIAMIGHGHGLAEALGFIVNRTRTDGIYVAPIGFFLRMFQRIAVTLRGRRDQVFCPILARYIQSMKSAQRTNLQSLDSVFRVIDWAGWTGEMEYVIDLATVEGLVNVELLEFKSGVVVQVFKVGLPPGQQVIYGDDRITLTQQRVTQVGT